MAAMEENQVELDGEREESNASSNETLVRSTNMCLRRTPDKAFFTASSAPFDHSRRVGNFSDTVVMI